MSSPMISANRLAGCRALTPALADSFTIIPFRIPSVIVCPTPSGKTTACPSRQMKRLDSASHQYSNGAVPRLAGESEQHGYYKEDVSPGNTKDD
jgi:hypothetical protein